MQQFLWYFFQWLSQHHQNSHYSSFPSIPSHLTVCTVQCCLSTPQRCLSTPQRTWRGRRSDVTGRRPSLRCDTEVLTVAESLRQFPSPLGRRRSSAPSGVSVSARSPRRCSPTLIIVDSYLTYHRCPQSSTVNYWRRAAYLNSIDTLWTYQWIKLN